MSGSSHRHRRGRSPWPDLPPELLGLVLQRLHSHADRVRLSAVCHAWRSGARLLRPLPPLLPWLALPDGTFLSLPNGAVHRLPVPRDVASRVSTGGALLLVHRDGRCSLTGPSRASATTSTRLAAFRSRRNRTTKHRADDDMVRKVVVSDSLVAVLKSTGRNSVLVGSRTATTEWVPPAGSFTVDIALFKGKLYVLTADLDKRERELHVLDIAGDGRITSACCIRSVLILKEDHDHEDPRDGPNDHDNMLSEEGWWYDKDDLYVQRYYLVVSGDQLLMVKRMMDSTLKLLRDRRTRWFEVFQATGLSGSGHGRWTEVKTLMGRTLFVSRGCSQSLPAASTRIREDCIYFMNENDKYTNMSNKKIYEDPFRDSGVYNLKDRTMTPLVSSSETLAPPTTCDGPWSPTWLFPIT